MLLLFCCTSHAQKKKPAIIEIVESGKDFSIRGLSIPGPGSIWISGSNGTAGISTDSGRSYVLFSPEGYNDADFRDIHAFNDSEAVIINAGSPAYILKTADGGKNWKEVYQNSTPEIFYDGFDFWDRQHGIAFSDPMQGKFGIITTHDGGETWQVPDSLDIPDCFPGEAGFAASGSSICCGKPGHVIIGTGGTHARVFMSEDYGRHWTALETPMISGKETTGIFSVTLSARGSIYIIGGNYKDDSIRGSTFFFSDDQGKTWQPSTVPPSGYRSCMIRTETSLLATGTNGSDKSINEGITWTKIDGNSFHVAGTCKNCPFIIFAGMHGKTGFLPGQ